MQHLDKLYKKHDIAWFTPVELFKVLSLLQQSKRTRFFQFGNCLIDAPFSLYMVQPWYAYAIAASILRTANLSVPLKVISLSYHSTPQSTFKATDLCLSLFMNIS